MTIWGIVMKVMGSERTYETIAFQERSGLITIRAYELSQALDSAFGLTNQHWRNLWQETSFERPTPHHRHRRTAKRYGQQVSYLYQERGRTIP